MRIVMIDNYDSFTFNVVQLVEVMIDGDVEVVRNDAFDPAGLLATRPDAIIISPGPGLPADAGRIVDLVRRNDTIPLLGVCLGHQAIGEAFGATVVRGSAPVHGKTSPIRHRSANLFAGCPDPMEVARYHSLVIAPDSLPEDLEVDAATDDAVVMAVTHRRRPTWGVQFHPESYGTRSGDIVVRNFLAKAGLR